MEKLLTDLIQTHAALVLCDEFFNQLQGGEEINADELYRFGSMLSPCCHQLDDCIRIIEDAAN